MGRSRRPREHQARASQPRASQPRTGQPRAVDVAPAALPAKRPGRPGGQRDRNRRSKVQSLSDAALALFLARGIEGTRIDEITAAAGVAKGSFYRYFSDKAQLVATLFEPLAAAVTGVLDRAERDIENATARDALVAAYTHLGLELGRLLTVHTAVVRLYLQEKRAPAVGARLSVAQLARQIEVRAEALSLCARQRGLLRASPPPRISTLAVIGAAEALLHAHLGGADLGVTAEVPAMLTSIVMDGMRPRSRGEGGSLN
jgi:AcrR family transcriptional regulator